MEVLPATSKELTSYTALKKSNQNRHQQSYFSLYYQKNQQKYLLANQKYRAKLQLNKSPKSPSPFQKAKTNLLLKLLVNPRSFVPVPSKLKHPIIKNWNADNYWYKPKLDFNNLERGCVRIIEDNWNKCFIIWLDIDEKGWTKLAKQLRCGYITSPKKHIRIPVPVKNLEGLKTGTLYFQGKKIGDAKLSGEVMLPDTDYYDKNGQKLGFYRYKAWGTFFPLRNKIWANAREFFAYLSEKSGIEYQSIREHFIIQKNGWNQPTFKLKQLPFSVREPPWQKMIITPKILSENRT
jgi:hypothetical protein